MNKMTKKATKSLPKSVANKKKESRTRKSTATKSNPPTIKLIASSDLTPYLPKGLPEDMVRPQVWELQNRKAFYRWVQSTFAKYNTSDPAMVKRVASEGVNPLRTPSQLFGIQKLVRDFMQGDSPYRGLLLYFGLGVGKTLSALAVSEAIQNRRQVLFLSKKSLESNFVNTIQRAGQDYMVKTNAWVFVPDSSPRIEELSDLLHVPMNVIRANGGIYLIDYTKQVSNYDSMAQDHRQALNKQIMAVIHARFRFLHYNDSYVLKKVTQADFDNAVIVIDEVHNLTNGMTRLTGKAPVFYNYFMNATNSKFIFLTGTPIINRIFEMAKLFNVLRGYIDVLTFKINVGFGPAADFNKIKAALLENKHVDQVVVQSVNRTIQVTQLPDHYIQSPNSAEPGIVYRPNEPVYTLDDLQADVESKLKGMGYKYTVEPRARETCLPDDPEVFESMFYNADLNKVRNPDILKKRIAGLLSFYDYKDPVAFPDLAPGAPHIVQCPMSLYQLGRYEVLRSEEIRKDTMQARRRKGDEDDLKSTYRLRSRLACSFVYPDDVPNPYELKDVALAEKQIEELRAAGEEVDDLDMTSEKQVDDFVKETLMKTLRKNRTKYFSIASGALGRLSPKYVEMIKNIRKCPGLILVYSYFLTMIGLNMFALALEETGEWAKFEIKKIDGLWHLVSGNGEFEEPTAKRPNYYIFYTGKEDKDYLDIVRLIYNSEWDQLGDNCQPLKTKLKSMYGKEENLRGQVIRMLMTTVMGTEGLDLKNVRSIHITEPYWQPVLIDQVIGRGVRNNSHIRLKPEERNVDVYIYMATIPSKMLSKITHPNVRADVAKYDEGLDMKGRVVSSDESLYILSEHKKEITKQLTHIMKEAAFDCTLNYTVNSQQHKDLVCLDYDTANREDYLYNPTLEGTKDLLDIQQEVQVVENYTEHKFFNHTYYVSNTPTEKGEYLIYTDALKKMTRKPTPVGAMIVKDGKKLWSFSKEEKAKWAK